MPAPSKTVEEIVAEIGDGKKFQITGNGVAFPYGEFWYEVDRIEAGRIILKIVEPPQ